MKTVILTAVLSGLALCVAPDTGEAQEVIEWMNQSGWSVGDTRPDTVAAGLRIRFSIARSTNRGQVRAVIEACNRDSTQWRGAIRMDEDERPTSSAGSFNVPARGCLTRREHINADSRSFYLWIKKRSS